jgi:hypothetical protein
MRKHLVRGQGRRFHLFALSGLVVALLGGFMVTAAVAAPVTIGQTSASANYVCVQEIDTQSGVASGAGYAVPAGGGLLTSWSTFAGSDGGVMSLMIFRPTAVAGSYTVVAESPVQTLTASVLNTFTASIALQGGDLIGFWSDGADCGTITNDAGDLNPYSPASSPPAVGATVALTTFPGYLQNISGVVTPTSDLVANLVSSATGVPPGTSLADKAKQIQRYVTANNHAGACAGLTDFLGLVKAQTGKKLTTTQAGSFTQQAMTIRATLGC